MKKLSGNTLSELMDLLANIQQEIYTYRHVSECLPKKLTNAIDEYQEKLTTEYIRRENEE